MLAERCDFKSGDCIGHKYAVQKKLGEGAFGKVFKVSYSGRDYALKLLKLWEVHPEIRQQLSDRFDMEYQTGLIDSPYLVTSEDYGTVYGNPYIVMEYCSGGDLSKVDENTDLVKIARQVLLGLRALHTHGKVHRDLKPENVLLKQDGTAVLTDFGISGDRNKRMTERNILGKPMQIFGTYAYMPPEQINPKRGNATVLPTTDIFSFGVMMYQLLTGTLPFGRLETEADLAMYIKNGNEGQWDRNCLRRKKDSTIFLPIIEASLIPDYRKRIQSVDDVLEMLPQAGGDVDIISNELFTPKHISGYCLRIMQGEEYGKVYDLTSYHRNLLTMGRQDFSVRNVIPVCEDNSSYISRKHCTLEYDISSGVWFIRDGQWDPYSSNGWKNSLNGTYVNSTEVSESGYFLSVGDIISIGDTKMRFEAY